MHFYDFIQLFESISKTVPRSQIERSLTEQTLYTKSFFWGLEETRLDDFSNKKSIKVWSGAYEALTGRRY